ncbi:MAG: response regulator [Verrucomicrobiaceae bacterium]|nr:response regulator [Verrucomicrobiaceae bacterium]
MAKLTGFSTTLIGILDDQREGIVIVKALWRDGELVDRGLIDLSDSPLSETLRTKSVVRIESGDCDYHPDNVFLSELEADAFIGLPIVFSSGEICGFFCGVDTKPQSYTMEHRKAHSRSFAGRIAVELDRSWAIEALERKIASASLLESISTQIRESFDPDEIVQSAIDRLGDGLNVDRCFILSYYLSTRPELVLTGEDTVDGVDSIEDWNVKIEGSAFFERLLQEDELLSVESLDDDALIDGALKQVLKDLNVQSMVAVQTSYQNQTSGILLLQQCHSKRIWAADEQVLVKSVADMVGIALGQARMFENERLQRHELARKNRALAKANANADSANHAKSEFLSRMSHELRTLLNAILGFAQVMATDSMATAQQQQNLTTITSSGTHLLEMINDVLEMSRIEAGEVSVDPTSFSLEELLDSVVSMFQTHAHPGVKLKLGISPTVPVYARTDEVKLRQILINLFGNAVKFTEHGEVALRVRAEQRYPEGICSAWNLIVSVHDTGPGIHGDEVGMLFQAFSQTETGQKIQQGTGQGLPISRQFARLLGGDISVQSRPGKGTIFSLKIPCGEANPAELDDRRLAQNQRARGLALEQQPPKVMIVDDHQESRVWLEMLLSSIGLPAQTAVNGADALKQCQAEVPDIVFMDIHMPVMDGDTAAKELRELLGEETPLLVALTASAFIDGNDRVADGPFDLFLPKPVHEKSLVDIFEKKLEVRFDYGNEADENWFLSDFGRKTALPADEDSGDSNVILKPLDPEVTSLTEIPLEVPEEVETPEPVLLTEADGPSVLTLAICAMPEIWQEQLIQASARLNLQETRQVLEEMKEEHPSEAMPLQKWCEDFQFEKLQIVIERARAHRHATS